MKLSKESACREKRAQHSNILAGLFVQGTEKEELEKSHMRKISSLWVLEAKGREHFKMKSV